MEENEISKKGSIEQGYVFVPYIIVNNTNIIESKYFSNKAKYDKRKKIIKKILDENK